MNCLQNNCTCANPRGNLVYLTKVFYDAEENASPILTALTTTTAGFSQQLSVGGSVCNNIASNCSSGCGNTCHNTGCGCGGSKQLRMWLRYMSKDMLLLLRRRRRMQQSDRNGRHYF